MPRWCDTKILPSYHEEGCLLRRLSQITVFAEGGATTKGVADPYAICKRRVAILAPGFCCSHCAAPPCNRKRNQPLEHERNDGGSSSLATSGHA